MCKMETMASSEGRNNAIHLGVAGWCGFYFKLVFSSSSSQLQQTPDYRWDTPSSLLQRGVEMVCRCGHTCVELDPVLEVQDGVVATVLLSHLLLLTPVKHFLWSYLSIGCLLRSDYISQEGSCPSLNRIVSLLGTLLTWWMLGDGVATQLMGKEKHKFEWWVAGSKHFRVLFFRKSTLLVENITLV